MKTLGVIPARIGSKRFPEKVIASIAGKPMIQHVYENAQKSGILDKLIVATDDDKVVQAVESFGGEAMLTGEHRSGTDRVFEVAQKLKPEIVINIQGDEPLLRPEMLRQLVLPLKQYPDEVPVATLATVLRDEAALNDPNVVKVVFSIKGDACYFSRSRIPFVRDEKQSIGFEIFKHLGFYGFQYAALEKFCHLPVSKLELVEQLEQLRALENGLTIRVCVTEKDTLSVDVPEDVEKVEEKLKAGWATV